MNVHHAWIREVGSSIVVSLCALALLLGVPGRTLAQIEMPDAALIHGRAIPAPELPAGTVTVRVVREAIGNDLPGEEVRVIVNGGTRTATTDAEGRAEFPNLPESAEARAEATVGDEMLESVPFQVPAAGGLRVILVAGLTEAAERRAREQAEEQAAPPVSGSVVIGTTSRILIEFRDDTLQAFYVLDIVNNARNRVDIGGPFIIDLPTGAAGAAVLEGSSPAATVSGDRVTVTGPFAPGSTMVQVGFLLPYDEANVTVEQTFPALVEQVTVALERIGDVGISSPHFSTVGDVRANDGTPYMMGSGPSLAPGDPLVLQLANLPVHSRTPRYVALTLALGVVALGVWLAVAGRPKSADVRRRLTASRDTLLGELTQLEQRRRGGGHDPKQAARRQRLLAELERIYAELDEHAGPPGGGEGRAA